MRIARAVAEGPMALAVLVTVLVYVGVVLPAVWSRDRARRVAASNVLRQILTFFRRTSN